MTGPELKAWRVQHRLTQIEAAAALHWSRRFYQYAEAREGDIDPRLALAVKGYEAEKIS